MSFHFDDYFCLDHEIGDFVNARIDNIIFEDENGETENPFVYLKCYIIDLKREQLGRGFIVDLAAVHTIEMEDGAKVQALMRTKDQSFIISSHQIYFGDSFIFDHSAIENGEASVEKKYQSLRKNNFATKNDIEAKIEAYCDPSIAAISEFCRHGLKTRNSFYKRESCG